MMYSDSEPCRHAWYQGSCAHCALDAVEWQAMRHATRDNLLVALEQLIAVHDDPAITDNADVAAFERAQRAWSDARIAVRRFKLFGV